MRLAAVAAVVVLMAIVAVGGTVSVAANASSNIQPPSGETWGITTLAWGGAGGTGTDAGRHDISDGAVAAALNVFWNQPTDANGLGAVGHLMIVLTNANYMRMIAGAGGGAVSMGYRGVKL